MPNINNSSYQSIIQRATCSRSSVSIHLNYKFLRHYIQDQHIDWRLMNLDKPATYRIKVRGVVPDSWADRLGGLEIVETTSEEMMLEGWLPDQAALAGVLDTLFSINLSILEVKCLPDR